ncbi:MAG: hypothetical protein OEY52_07290 [Gammaproteobacteria bacterium]|nr:hypothetical protein [Gammaproteobacteria bacterium]
MNTTHHPDADQLNNYICDPGSNEFRQVRLHLMECIDCRAEVDMLMNLKSNLGSINIPSIDAGNKQALDLDMLDRHLNSELNATEQQQLEDIIKKEPQAMKSALHYVSHRVSMDKGTVDTNWTQPQHSGSRFSDLFKSWFSVKWPVWMSVPITAIAASVFTIMLVPLPVNMTGSPAVIAYQDNPVIQFKKEQTLPGIGFFSGANKTAQPYGKLKVTLQGENTALLHWPEVENAESYTMHLKIYKQGRQISAGKHTTSKPQAKFTRVPGDTGHRYVWNLSGKTSNGQLFSAKGGFIIDKRNN